MENFTDNHYLFIRYLRTQSILSLSMPFSEYRSNHLKKIYFFLGRE